MPARGVATLSARDGETQRRLIFVLREKEVEKNFRGQNYHLGVCWTGEGFVGCRYSLAANTFNARDGLIKRSGYEELDSCVVYAKKWEQIELGRTVFPP